MQHTPQLSQTLEDLLKGRLREANYPFLDGAGPNAVLQMLVVVFVPIYHAEQYKDLKM
jgi:vacuolar protein sorting-associated protein 45